MSDDAKKKRFRKNKSGSIQKYQCGGCRRQFSINLGFENMHASPRAVTAAMELYFAGMSYRKVQRSRPHGGVGRRPNCKESPGRL